MRRLLLLVSAIVAADTAFFTALTPLLPHFADKYDLSKAAAGALVATYAAGALLGAVPGGVVTSRLGPKRAVLIGLTLMSISSLGFALAGTIWTLALARFVQGFGSVFSWAGGLAWIVGAAPRDRRGEMLGTAMGAAVFGALMGPVVGALGGLVGVRAAFLAVSGIGVALIAWAAATQGAEPERQRLRDGLRALHGRQIYAGAWLIVLPALLFGVLVVLVPLRLNDFGAFYTPGLALISDGAEEQGVAKGLAFGLMNAGWAVGAILGPAAGGALAAVAGDALPYLLMAVICLATYVATRVRFPAPAPT
jgi:MFS family permease